MAPAADDEHLGPGRGDQQRRTRRAGPNLPEHRDFWMLLLRSDHQLGEAFFHLARAAEHAGRIG